MNDENALLQRYADHGDETAFAELVHRKINLVYASALRQAGGDAHLAQDITQGVFLALATSARSVARHPALTAWLFATTRNVAAKARRTDHRWRRRETEANAMHILNRPHDPEWEKLRPVIDEALHELPEKDRIALLHRFFEGRSLAEIGTLIDVTENGARMRVDRALEKLRSSLARRGITSTAAALGAVLAAQPAIAAPAGLTAAVTASALSGAAAVAASATGTGTLTLLTSMTSTKIVGGTAAALVLFAAGAFVGTSYFSPKSPADVTTSELQRLKIENQRLSTEVKALRPRPGSNLTKPTGSSLAEAAPGASAGMGFRTVSGTGGAAFGPSSALSAESIDALAGKWQILAQLQKSKIAQSRVPLVDASGNLNEAAAKIFDLTPDEHTAIRDAVNRAREQIEGLESANATVSRNDKGDYVIMVKPFPESGGHVYDDLMKTFAQTLGPDRNAAFITLAANQVDQAFAQFGATSRTVTVTSQPGSKDSPYLVRDEQKAPNSQSTSTSNYKSRDEMLKRVGTVTKLLPSDL